MSDYLESESLHVSSLPTVTFYSITLYLLPYERCRLQNTCKQFYQLLHSQNAAILKATTISNRNTFFNDFRYICNLIFFNNLIIPKKRFFFSYELQSFDLLSNDIYFALKYFFIYHSQIKQQLLKKGKSDIVPIGADVVLDVQTRYVLNVSRNNDTSKITKFIDDIFRFGDGLPSCSLILCLQRSNINNKCIAQWCHTMLYENIHDVQVWNITKIDISFNAGIDDNCMQVLFECIGDKMRCLNTLNVSSTNITDKTCDIIVLFYTNYYQQQRFLSDLNVKNEKKGIRLSVINLMRCRKTSEKGVCKMMADVRALQWCPYFFTVHYCIPDPQIDAY